MTKTTPKATKAQRAAIKGAMQRAALHLIPKHTPGGIAEAEAQCDAHDLIRAAVVLCARGNQRDLGERLLVIAAELRSPGAIVLEARPSERQALPAVPARKRRKIASSASPGKRARAKMAKRGCLSTTVGN